MSLSSLTLDRTDVVGGASLAGTVRLDRAAAAGGAKVTIRCDSEPVVAPAAITIPAGTKAGSFQIETTRVDEPTSVELTAEHEGVQRKAQLELAPAVTVTAVTLDAETATGGGTVHATATFSGPVPTDGVTLASEASGGSIVVPGDVAVAAGATTATFAVETKPVAVTTKGRVFVICGGANVSARLQVNPPEPVALSLTSPTIAHGGGITAKVTLSGTAPEGGFAIAVSASNPALRVPARVLVDPGAASVRFPITAHVVGTPVTATVHAGNLSAELAFVPPLAALSLEGIGSDRSPTAGTLTVALSGSAPAGGATIALEHTVKTMVWHRSPPSPVPLTVAIPPSIVIPAGEKQTRLEVPLPGFTFDVDTYAITLTATYAGTTVTAEPFGVIWRYP